MDAGAGAGAGAGTGTGTQTHRHTDTQAHRHANRDHRQSSVSCSPTHLEVELSRLRIRALRRLGRHDKILCFGVILPKRHPGYPSRGRVEREGLEQRGPIEERHAGPTDLELDRLPRPHTVSAPRGRPAARCPAGGRLGWGADLQLCALDHDGFEDLLGGQVDQCLLVRRQRRHHTPPRC